ncbi:MAG: glycosyltransferase family 9 protein [Candidatus Latescibacteria bacterium]|nr:glycosyltransferase family 9 protein [Candidatus Latescibacterota bacterium]
MQGASEGPVWYRLEKKLKTWAIQQLARRAQRKAVNVEHVDWSNIRRILVVRQHDQFGDFLLTTPAIYALRRQFPKSFISLVVRPYLYPVAQNNPDVDEVLVFRSAGFLRGMIRRFDLAIVFNTVSHSLSSDLIARLSRASLVLGPETPTFDHCATNPFYTLVSPVDSAVKHQIQRNLDVVRHIGANTSETDYRFTLKDAEHRSAAHMLSEHGGDRIGRMVAVHFGTGDVRKRYPISMLADVCNGIARRGQHRILLFQAPGEIELRNELLLQLEPQPISAPAMSLRQVAVIMKNADLLICNDTGVLHLSAAVGTPSLSFHATSDPAVWKPPASRHVALYASDGEISSIPVKKALSEALHLLEKGELDSP